MRQLGPKADRVRAGLLLIATAVAAVAALGAVAPAAASGGGFNQKGNVLIADQFNNRVIEIDRNHHIVWQFGVGPTDFTPNSIVGVNDAERVGSLTLLAGTGTPPGVVATCSDPNGCPDNRVMLVNQAKQIVWQYGTFGPGGSGPNQLDTPVQATFLPGGHILITDQANQRVIEVNQAKQIVWQYGMTGVSGSADNFLTDPNSAQLLESGNILIADENNDRAIVVNRAHHVLRSFTAHGTLSGVAFASRLGNGDTLITDSNNSRIVEVNSHDTVVWQYFTNKAPGSNSSPAPTRAVRLMNGDTLISDQFNDRVIEVTPAGKTVFNEGRLNMPGFGNGFLNAPYDAKVIGDYTGLTEPFGN